jgi:hypothetical protein
MIAEKVDMQIPVLIHGKANLVNIGRSLRYRFMAASNIMFVHYDEEKVY